MTLGRGDNRSGVLPLEEKEQSQVRAQEKESEPGKWNCAAVSSALAQQGSRVASSASTRHSD